VPTIYNHEDLDKLKTVESEIGEALNKVISKLYLKKRPEVYFSSRLLPRSSFPSLFAK